jgi:hypothetical protein
MSSAAGTFQVDMAPGASELDGDVARWTFTKVFRGDLEGAGSGVMLSAGDPRTGSAGYVAMETVRGRLADREGGFALQQLGLVHDGAQTLHYEVVPGSGHGGLAGISGSLHLDVDEDGTHRYELAYEL